MRYSVPHALDLGVAKPRWRHRPLHAKHVRANLHRLRVTGTRLGYDACTASNIPTNASIAMGYVDGSCRWSVADWSRFPNSVLVRISSIGSNDGHVLDVEPGNLNARQSVDWVLMRRAAGIDPTVYVAQWAPGYTWSDVNAAFDARGVARPWIWLAPIASGVIPNDPQVIGVQYGYIGPYDLSNIRAFWPGVDGIVPESPKPVYAISSSDS